MKISRVRTAEATPAPTFTTAPRVAKKALPDNVGVGVRTKVALLAVAGVLVGVNVLLSNATQAPSPHVAAQISSAASPLAAFEVGRYAPSLALRISSPVQYAGQSSQIGFARSWFGEGAAPVVVGILSTSPRCDCGSLFRALNALAATATSSTYQVVAVDASRIGTGAERTTLDQQLAFDVRLKVTIGIDPANPMPPNDIASVWADGVVPSIIIIDHDYRVRYIARGADVADTVKLKTALRESVGHYRRERGLSPMVTI